MVKTMQENTKIVLADQNHCTGCGACANICPKAAIQMLPDEEGFIQPVIDDALCVKCKLCEKTCPVLSCKKNANSLHPNIYAMRADDEIRSRSSSGGIFTLAAQWILSQNGVVCGAAFDDNMQLKHILIESENDLDQLRGSKYLQSNVNDIYIRIKSLLNSNRKVLFSGTPCQVAALYSVVGENENLYTVDILCHGVPSQAVFNLYCDYIARGRKISSVNFRSKEFGWVANHIKIEFDNKENHVGTDREDPYEIGFLRNLFLRRSCESCSFSEFPRWGDISIGDYWGISKMDPSQNDGKGTSIFLANSEKGKEIFNAVYKKTTWKKTSVLPNSLPNRLKAECVFNINRDRFFSLIKTRSIKDAVDMAMSRKYDVGLVCNYCAPNFGGALTHYALYHVLEDMGYSTLLIEEPLSAFRKIFPNRKTYLEIMDRCFLHPIYPKHAMSSLYETTEDMRILNRHCDIFLVGSDQLFQYALYNQHGQFVSLNWVEGYKKKIAYAASFGHGEIFGDDIGQADLAYWLNRYDSFSVREDSGIAICRDQYGLDAEQVLDPVFLVEKKYYLDLIKKAEKCELPKQYVGFYILDPDNEKACIIEHLKSKFRIASTGFSEFNAANAYLKPLDKCNPKNYKGEERLKLISQSALFVTDSFHGTCLAIIMNRPFVTILNAKRGSSRFYSILKMFGLQSRLVTSYSDFIDKQSILEKPIDWVSVNAILSKEKEKSILWLKNALNRPKIRKNDSYDILIRKMQEQNRLLSERLNLLEKNYSMLLSGKKTKTLSQGSSEKGHGKKNIICMIKKGIVCFRENGAVYTFRKIIDKINNY